MTETIGSRYNAVQIWHSGQQRIIKTGLQDFIDCLWATRPYRSKSSQDSMRTFDINQVLSTQKTPHCSPSWAFTGNSSRKMTCYNGTWVPSQYKDGLSRYACGIKTTSLYWGPQTALLIQMPFHRIYRTNHLTNCGLVTACGVVKFGHHWLRWWLRVASS